MGKGDKKTRRGKIWRSSYGKKRPHDETEKKTTKEKGEGFFKAVTEKVGELFIELANVNVNDRYQSESD